MVFYDFCWRLRAHDGNWLPGNRGLDQIFIISLIFFFFLHILYFDFSLCFYPCNRTVHTKANRMFHGLLNTAKQWAFLEHKATQRPLCCSNKIIFPWRLRLRVYRGGALLPCWAFIRRFSGSQLRRMPYGGRRMLPETWLVNVIQPLTTGHRWNNCVAVKAGKHQLVQICSGKAGLW